MYDTTLRDGAQMVGTNFSGQDKYFILEKLIEDLTVSYVEVYPFSNPKDRKLIDLVKEKNPKWLNHLVAFGSTRHVKNKSEEDANLISLVESGLKHATIFGKSWDLHLEVIHADKEENLEMIRDSVRFLKENDMTVFYDAEHFYDGYKSDPEYALNTIIEAEKAGADIIILCDTNGGCLPEEIREITSVVLEKTSVSLGIHAHNDCGLGVANSLAAVNVCLAANRVCQVQGTINGVGERVGNANLTTILPILAIKMGLEGVIPRSKLRNLRSVSNFIFEIMNKNPPKNQPFVGQNAFSHKGGMHIAAMKKDYDTYEHVKPDSVGNKRRFMVSEMAGRSALIHKCKKFGIDLKKDDPIVSKILKTLKRKESHGYTYEGADASLEILIRGMMYDPEQESAYLRRYFFEVEYFRVITDVRNVFQEDQLEIFTDGNIKLLVANPKGFAEFHTAAEGNGPVNAIDSALKKAILHFYPVLDEIELIDFKVRIANEKEAESGTASRVRVLVVMKDKDGETWGTIGSHVNITVASFVALLDSYVYKLMKEDVSPFISKNELKEK